MTNKILLGVGAVIIIFLLLFGVYKLVNGPSQSLYPAVNVVKPDDHIKWSPDKKHILVEYSDLQCPACQNFHNLIRSQLEATQSGQVDVTRKITFVYRHFPLTQIHEHAQEAAYAAEAAGHQGKFFEYADSLFDNQAKWESSTNVQDYFLKLAQQLNLNADQFKLDENSKTVKDKVDADILSAEQASVNATPTFFLDGQKLDNITSFDDFKKLLIDTANSTK